MKFLYLFCSAAFLFSCQMKSVIADQKNNIIEVVNSSDVTIVDVRIPEQFKEASAKNAVNIPLAEIADRSPELLGKKVVVFCNKGIQADEAVKVLRKNGVEVYDGTTLKNVKAIQNLKN